MRNGNPGDDMASMRYTCPVDKYDLYIMIPQESDLKHIIYYLELLAAVTQQAYLWAILDVRSFLNFQWLTHIFPHYWYNLCFAIPFLSNFGELYEESASANNVRI